MTKKQIKKRSKQMTLKQKYKIEKKVREHHRKLKKEAKKAKQNGVPVKNASKLTRIPNLFPKKKVEMELQDFKKELEKLTQRKNAIITKEDIENLVKEDTTAIVKRGDDDDNTKMSKHKK